MSEQELLQRIERIERFLANLGPIANVSERLAQCERLAIDHGLDIEKNGGNVFALLEEYKLIKERLNTQLGMIHEAKSAAGAARDEIHQQGHRLNQLARSIDAPGPLVIRTPLSPGELAQAQAISPNAVALYGGEQ